MNWEAIGSVAEALGALGVIVTLVYLSTQVRSNTAAIRAGTAQQVTNRASEISQSLALDPSATELRFRGLVDPDSLSDEEQRRFYALMLAIFRAFENVEFQYRKGFLDPGVWSGLSNNLRSAALQPGFAICWTQGGRSGFNREFQAYVDAIIAKSKRSA